MGETHPLLADWETSEKGMTFPFHQRSELAGKLKAASDFWPAGFDVPDEFVQLPPVPDDWRPVFCLLDEAPVYLTPTGWLVMASWGCFVDANLAPAFRVWPADQNPALLYLAFQDLASVIDRVGEVPTADMLSEDAVFTRNAQIFKASAEDVADTRELYREILNALTSKDWDSLDSIPLPLSGRLDELDVDELCGITGGQNDADEPIDEGSTLITHERFLLPIEMTRLSCMGHILGSTDEMWSVGKSFAKHWACNENWTSLAADSIDFWAAHGFCPVNLDELTRKHSRRLSRNRVLFVAFTEYTYLSFGMEATGL